MKELIRPLIEAVASNHHGDQRARDLISGQASVGRSGNGPDTWNTHQAAVFVS